MSGSKRIIQPFYAIQETSMSADIVGKVSDTRYMDYASFIISWKDGVLPVGNVIFEALAYGVDGEAEVWKQLDFGSSIFINGSSGQHEVIFNAIPFAKLRCKYVRTSGTGTLTVYAIVKEG